MNWDAITAAWDGPKAGRIENKEPVNDEARDDLEINSLSTSGKDISCGGTLDLFLNDKINNGNPKNPANNGSNGSLMLEFNTTKPIEPDIKNRISANNLDPFSLRIKNKDASIKINAIYFLMKL